MRHTSIMSVIKQHKGNGLLAEFVVLIRFGLVGGLATGIHITILWILLSNTPLPVLVANAIAFASAFGFSFAGNYLWTFSSPGSLTRTMRRFLIISLSAFLLNNVLLTVILELGWLDSTPAALVSAAVIPVITFLASRFWGFEYKNPPSPQSRTDMKPFV